MAQTSRHLFQTRVPLRSLKSGGLGGGGHLGKVDRRAGRTGICEGGFVSPRLSGPTAQPQPQQQCLHLSLWTVTALTPRDDTPVGNGAQCRLDCSAPPRLLLVSATSQVSVLDPASPTSEAPPWPPLGRQV